MENNNQNLNKNQENKENTHNYQPTGAVGKSHKIAAFFLVVLTFFAFGMWIVQFKSNLVGPGGRSDSEGINSSLSEAESAESSKQKDTDKDGLSDWDELNYYNTSPYLEDSDSDGITDKQEIASGTNPNCPTGKECAGEEFVNNTNDGPEQLNAELEKLNDLLVNTSTTTPPLNLDGTQSSQPENLQNILSGQSDAQSLRKMLLEAGMDEKMLGQISDDDLMKSYSDVLKGNK